jgi:hypothetical protein
MVDTPSTNDPTLVTETEIISSSFVPLNIDRHDSQIEINNYYINHTDDLLGQSEFKTLELNEDLTSMSIIEENSCRLEVSELLEEVINF